MQDVVNKILEQNKDIFGNYKEVKKLNIGFTNTIYTVDDKFVIKICTNPNNEEKFKKEIYFYNNKENDLIPKLYYFNTNKDKVPYIYEIIEKIDGDSLFDVWHTFSEYEREKVIEQLCVGMKVFHSNKGNKYDWVKKTSDLYINLYNKVKELKLFSEDELKLLNEAYNRFPEFLNSDEFVLVHNDLHFDNIFYKDGRIKLIDFERSLYAPRDFELDIIYRMVRKPWKFANEENEKYTKKEDYENIMHYIEKYYPQIFLVNDLSERLAIYDIVYYLKQYIEYPLINELKENILNAAMIVVNGKKFCVKNKQI